MDHGNQQEPRRFSRLMARRSLLVPTLLLAAATARAFDITECGQAIHAREVGDLRTDLVCAPLQFVAVYLSSGGTLNTNGHTITGAGTAIGTGVQCSGARSRGFCTVNGPGVIINFDTAVAGAGGSLRIRGLTASRNAWGLTHKAPRVIELLDVDMSDNLKYGITARGGRMRGRNVTANRNGKGGVWAPVQEMVNLTAIGNGSDGGVYAVSSGQKRAAHLIDSTITGNDGLGQGFDVLATVPVKLRNTTCGRGARVRVTNEGGVKTTTITRGLGCAGD
jgi:hypothetical protein